MRIVILGSAHPLRGGGIASFNERLAQALQDEGHDVDIYSFSLQYPGFLFPGRSQFTDEPAPAGLRIFSRVHSLHPLNWIKVGRELRKAGYDLLIVRYWMPFFAPCLGTIQQIARKNGKTKVICIADNIVPHEKRPGDGWLTRYFLNRVDACLTMSRSVLNDLRAIRPDLPAVHSPHPLYDNYGEKMDKCAARSALGLPPEGKIILFFGFIRKYKGLDILLEAMADPRVRELGVRLLVAGEYYGDKARYEAIIDRFGLRPEVTMHTDFIPNDRVAAYFSAADCVALPYRSATQSGITQVACHFSLPMIATDVGGLPEVVRDGETGYLCQPVPTDLADAIVRFCTEKKERIFAHNMETEKKKYSWEAFAERIFSLAGM